MKFKRICTVFCCLVIALSSIGCNKTKRPGYSVGLPYMGVTVDSFAQKLKEEEFNNKEFYVLAPYYLVDDGYNTRLGISLSLQGYVESEPGLVKESFYVCNEEKYGKQITDWGQYSGVAKNFTIDIAINIDYSDKITNLKFDYYSEESYQGVLFVRANLYNGKYCFATIEAEGYACEVAVLKSNVESYIREFLMLKSEFLKLYEAGEIEKSTTKVEAVNPTEKSRLWATNRYAEDSSLWTEYANTDIQNTYVVILANPEDVSGGTSSQNSSHVCSYGKDEDGNLIEPYYCRYLRSYIKELCNSWHNDELGNIALDIVVIPIPSIDVDLANVTFEWWSHDVVNLYYEDYLFATATFFIGCDDCKDDATIKFCVENYILERLQKVND